MYTHAHRQTKDSIKTLSWNLQNLTVSKETDVYHTASPPPPPLPPHPYSNPGVTREPLEQTVPSPVINSLQEQDKMSGSTPQCCLQFS